jgi:hypothetical protein
MLTPFLVAVLAVSVPVQAGGDSNEVLRFAAAGADVTIEFRTADRSPRTVLLGTSTFGRTAAWTKVAEAAPTRAGSTVEYRRADFVEWFREERQGLHHGWTIPAAPQGNPRDPL